MALLALASLAFTAYSAHESGKASDKQEKAAREAISLDPVLKDKIRPGKDDRRLACAKNKRPLCFSKSLFAIVLCVFVIEYRVNQKAKQQGISD